MVDLLGPPRDPDAPLEQRHRTWRVPAQIVYEEAFFALLMALHRRYPVPNLALPVLRHEFSGHGKVYLRTPFRRMYLPAALVTPVARSARPALSNRIGQTRGQRAENRSQKSEIRVLTLTSDL